VREPAGTKLKRAQPVCVRSTTTRPVQMLSESSSERARTSPSRVERSAASAGASTATPPSPSTMQSKQRDALRLRRDDERPGDAERGLEPELGTEVDRHARVGGDRRAVVVERAARHERRVQEPQAAQVARDVDRALEHDARERQLRPPLRVGRADRVGLHLELALQERPLPVRGLDHEPAVFASAIAAGSA